MPSVRTCYDDVRVQFRHEHLLVVSPTVKMPVIGSYDRLAVGTSMNKAAVPYILINEGCFDFADLLPGGSPQQLA